MNAAVLILLGSIAVGLVVATSRMLDAAVWRRSLVVYRLRLPEALEADAVVGWLSSLAAFTHAFRGALLPQPPVVVEITGTAKGIEHQLWVPRAMRSAVLSSIRASLPGARLDEVASPSAGHRDKAVLAAEVHLAGRQRQLAVDRSELVSRSLLAALQPLRGDESVRWQWTITGAGTPRPVRQSDAGNGRNRLPWWLESNAPADADDIRAARLKQREPMLHVVGRLVVTASDRKRASSLFGRSWGPIRLLNVPGARLVRSLWPSFTVFRRATRRSLPVWWWPLRLNAAELAGLVSFPFGNAVLPGLPAGITRQVPPPTDLSASGTILADSTYPGFDSPLAIGRRDRLMHVALLGPTGTGKSTLMINMAMQDAAVGDGLAVLDPKADMASDLLTHLPASRHDDVIIVNPADTDQPVGFNVLATDGSEAARELAVDHVLHVFHEQWKEFWGPRTDAVLRASLLVLTSARALDGSAFTVCEVPALLTNAAFRHWVSSQPSVPVAVHDFWNWFDSLSPAERTQVIGPVLNKLTALTQRTPLRLLLGQSAGIDLPAALQQRRILIMPLSRGLVGSETAALLSSLMMASLWQAALRRVQLAPAQRRPYWLFVDEASEVVRLPLDLADLMAEARGLGVGLTLATQHLSQLPTPVRNALLATVRSQIVFQVEAADATLLARSFGPTLTADDLRSLPAYEVAMRLSINGQTSRPMTGKTRPLPEATGNGADLRARSRARYGVPRRQVEDGLRTRIQVPAPTHQDFGKRPRQDGGQS